MGHDPHDLARSDGTEGIARWTLRICRSKLHGDRGNRSLIEPKSWLIRGEIVAHDSFSLVGHNFREIVATNWLQPHQTATIFGPKTPLKPVYSILSKTSFDRFVK